MINSIFNTRKELYISHQLIPCEYSAPTPSHQFISNLGDVFLLPAHFLFNGRNVTLFQNYVINDEAVFNGPKWVKNVLIISLIAPPLIAGFMISSSAATIASIPLIFLGEIVAIGLIFKTISFCFSAEREERKAMAKFYQEGQVRVEPQMPLRVAQRVLDIKMEKLKTKMTEVNVWKDPTFIKEVSDYLDDAAVAMNRFFDDLEKMTNHDVNLMAKFLTKIFLKKDCFNYFKTQKMLDFDQKEFKKVKKEKNPFIHHFFNHSYFDMYHRARRCMIWKDDSWQGKLILDTDQVPFFDPTKPQYQWRMKFNQLCDRFNQYIKKNGDVNETVFTLKETLNLTDFNNKPWNAENWNEFITTRGQEKNNPKLEEVIEEYLEEGGKVSVQKRFRNELLKIKRETDNQIQEKKKKDPNQCILVWSTPDEKYLKGFNEGLPKKPFPYEDD